MEIVIIYFSGTGNTELISEELKTSFEVKNNSVDLLSIENIDKIMKLNFENTLIGFGFPVYKFTFPNNFNKLFTFLNSLDYQIKYFQFCAYARFTANVFYDFSKNLSKKNFRLIAEQAFKTPENGISARKMNNDYEYESIMFFEDHINKKIDSFVESILNNIDGKKNILQKKPNLLAPILLKVVNDIEITKYPKLQIDKDKCTVCGLCAQKCPDHNLILNNDRIQILDDKNCLHCLRCMHHCSSNAIFFGKLTKGENRYTIKIRNELYQKSKSGFKEKYWGDFNQISKEWRIKTIKYWLLNRNNPEI